MRSAGVQPPWRTWRAAYRAEGMAVRIGRSRYVQWPQTEMIEKHDSGGGTSPVGSAVTAQSQGWATARYLAGEAGGPGCRTGWQCRERLGFAHTHEAEQSKGKSEHAYGG